MKQFLGCAFKGLDKAYGKFLLRHQKIARLLFRINPFNWELPQIKLMTGLSFALLLPIYIFVGLQPAPVDAVGLPEIEIPSIGLVSPVEESTLKDRVISVPDTGAGAYSQAENKTLIVGHVIGVFKNLQNVGISDTITYDGKDYQVVEAKTLVKADVNMREVLAAADRPTLIIMTCAGEITPELDATHRLIVTAVEI